MSSLMRDPRLQLPHLLAWTDDGQLALNARVEARTLSIAGDGDNDLRDCDLTLPALGPAVVFVRATAAGGTLFVHGPGTPEARLILVPGTAVRAAGLTWLLAHATVGLTDDPKLEGAWGAVLSELVTWLARPMIGHAELRESLKGFLSILVRNTPAGSGMLVLSEGGGFSLVTSYGLSPQEAETLWEKMPHALTEEVMRANARVLLPDELKRVVKNDSTVFVRGVRSVAGFPVLAEGRLVAVFYLGFDNLLKSLSAELQTALEAAADLLGVIIQRALLREEVAQMKLARPGVPVTSLPAGRLMIGSSEKLVEVYKLIGRLAPVDVAVLIAGETGTGKELAAKELHRLSPRAPKPLIVVNAAALPESLIESELFGHKKGAFTGALTDRIGLVEQAEGGTLFIDEIGELSQPMQAKLLRVLQEYAVTRIGEATPRSVNFRLVTATHRNLEEMVAAGQFREDLFYRIAGAAIRVPALRERDGDIVTLANFFRQQFAERHDLPDKEWSQDALIALESRPWPGNVRELENVVSRAFVMAEGTVIRRQDLGLGDAQGASATASTLQRQGATTTELEGGLEETTLMAARDRWTRSFLLKALRRHKGRRVETAKALGIGERTLFRYLEQFDIKDA